MQKNVIRKMVQQNQKYDEIQKELNKQFGEHALKRNTVYKTMQEVKLGLFRKEEHSKPEKPYDEQLLITIQREIEKKEFYSVRSLAHKLHSQPSLIHRYLTERLHVVYQHTRWIPTF